MLKFFFFDVHKIICFYNLTNKKNKAFVLLSHKTNAWKSLVRYNFCRRSAAETANFLIQTERRYSKKSWFHSGVNDTAVICTSVSLTLL
jgi:hypothetical protein